MALLLRGFIDLPRHPQGGFDHGDVHLPSGRVYVAHTAAGTIEVIDGDRCLHRATLPGCPEASGVLCAQDEGLVFAAARGDGRVLVIQAASDILLRQVPVGPKPNGLAWDSHRKCLLVADVGDFSARLVDPVAGRLLTAVTLPGRPRWCVYDPGSERFLVNVRDPAGVAVLRAETAEQIGFRPSSAPGPHGLDLDLQGERAFVACDGGALVALILETGHELARVAIPGEPDAIWYNPIRERLYVAIGKPGLIAVIDTALMTLAAQVETEEGAHTTAFDRVRQRLYAFLPNSCRAAVYEEA